MRVARLVHVRRELIGAGKSCSKVAAAAMNPIAELYRAENKWKASVASAQLAKSLSHRYAHTTMKDGDWGQDTALCQASGAMLSPQYS